MVHGLSCSAACGIFPGQGSNPCPLHWQADSQPLRHQGSPHGSLNLHFLFFFFFFFATPHSLQDQPPSPLQWKHRALTTGPAKELPLICISLMASDVENFFHVFIFHLYLLFGEMSLHAFCPFSSGLFVFYCRVLRVSYVFQIVVFCQICGLQIFPPSLYQVFSFSQQFFT